VPAFEKLNTNKKLVLVGGAPNPAEYERSIMATKDERIIFPGFIFGNRNFSLMKYAYAYVQPSDIEGLSPVILENMGLGVPIISSDIPENEFVVKDTALLFKQGDTDDLHEKMQWALDNPDAMKDYGARARVRAQGEFNWEKCADGYEKIFRELLHPSQQKSEKARS
jgi:glycosyltransferase involved in cell wall biosynthesis